jgi:4-hydroxy-tetrahydrodipicolinate synthase
MAASGRFGAVVCAMVTPFGPDGGLDIDGAVELARWLVEHGNDGLVLAGTTGESMTLEDDEKVELWKAVRSGVKAPLIANTGTGSTAHSARLTQAATDCGMDAILAVTPYYTRPSQAGIENHFRAIAKSTSLPVLAYDIPKRSGREVHTSTWARLASEGVLAGLKDAAGSPAATASLMAAVPSRFEIYSGDDALTLPLLALGAVGVISVVSHWAGPETSEMLASLSKGDPDAAAAVNTRLVPSYAFANSDEAPNPVPTKAMMRALGLPAGECRLPMGPTPPGLEDKARQVWSALRGRPFTVAG